MKNVRQVAILDIIQKHDIETQEDLAAALMNQGIRVTQATVSRDIRELRLVKVLTASGGYKYAMPDVKEVGVTDRLIRMLSESLLSIAASGNMLVLKTLSGSAGVAAEALDGLKWPEVLGTIAGDNTIFMVIRSEAEVPGVSQRITELMK